MLAKNDSKFEVKVVFCEPIPAYHLDALKVLIKKAALRKLQANNAGGPKRSCITIEWVGADSNHVK
jgi:hypothetical protein